MSQLQEGEYLVPDPCSRSKCRYCQQPITFVQVGERWLPIDLTTARALPNGRDAARVHFEVCAYRVQTNPPPAPWLPTDDEGEPRVLFIAREGGFSSPLDKPSRYTHLHVAERHIDPTLPEWRKMPYCRNVGVNFNNWRFVTLNPMHIHPSRICGGCLYRLEAHKVDLLIGLYAHTDPQN